MGNKHPEITTSRQFRENSKVYQTLKSSGGFPAHCCHRGGCRDFGPENTMWNYRRSVKEFQTQLLEIDLQLTKDGHLVIMHDSSLDRTTSGKGEIRRYSLEEVLQFDAAVHYPELKSEHITIPTFEEFLNEFLPKENLVFMLDFKDEDVAEKAMIVVEQRDMWHRILLGAVPPDANETLRRLRKADTPVVSDYVTSVELVKAYYNPLNLGRLSGFNFPHDIFGFILMERSEWVWGKGLVQAVHAIGKRVLVCGEALDSEERLAECIEYGVDFILCDRPDVLSKVLVEHRAKSLATK